MNKIIYIINNEAKNIVLYIATIWMSKYINVYYTIK
jgi:hypothetical protein